MFTASWTATRAGVAPNNLVTIWCVYPTVADVALSQCTCRYAAFLVATSDDRVLRLIVCPAEATGKVTTCLCTAISDVIGLRVWNLVASRATQQSTGLHAAFFVRRTHSLKAAGIWQPSLGAGVNCASLLAAGFDVLTKPRARVWFLAPVSDALEQLTGFGAAGVVRLTQGAWICHCVALLAGQQCTCLIAAGLVTLINVVDAF